MRKLAIIRIRGEVNVSKDIEITLKMLRLYKKHNCVIIPDTPYYLGMINKVKDHITWGEIDEQTLKLLLEKRARIAGKHKLTHDYVKANLKTDIDNLVKEIFSGKKEIKEIPGIKLFFKLRPPVQGFEPGGIKKPYSLGGSLGYRKDNINQLLRRMI